MIDDPAMAPPAAGRVGPADLLLAGQRDLEGEARVGDRFGERLGTWLAPSSENRTIVL
jgi:hypothetical protein